MCDRKPVRRLLEKCWPPAVVHFAAERLLGRRHPTSGRKGVIAVT